MAAEHPQMPVRRGEGAGFAIGAIFRNEGPYILEWLAYHRLAGVTEFLIADNGSDDGSTALLAALDRIGLVRHIPFPSMAGEARQIPAYREIARRHGRGWIAFIDADEFIVAEEGPETIAPWFSGIAARPDVGAVALNWAIYGSSGLTAEDGRTVLRRFTRRAPQGARVNTHYKSILRVEAFSGQAPNPHHFELRPDFRLVHADGSQLATDPQKGPGLATRALWNPVRINHYVVKSREEFLQRKRPRGRASVANAFRTERFFADHDRNEEDDPLPSPLLDAVEDEIARIAGLLAGAGHGPDGVRRTLGQRLFGRG